MTKQQVIGAEKRQPNLSTNNLLFYKNVRLASFNTNLSYKFTKLGLVEGRYMIDAKHLDHIGYYQDYLALKRSLTAKYGEPEQMDRWFKNLYKDEEESYGTAVALEHVTFMSKWTKGVTDIILILYGDNGNCANAIRYSYNLAPAETEEQDLKDF